MDKETIAAAEYVFAMVFAGLSILAATRQLGKQFTADGNATRDKVTETAKVLTEKVQALDSKIDRVEIRLNGSILTLDNRVGELGKEHAALSMRQAEHDIRTENQSRDIARVETRLSTIERQGHLTSEGVARIEGWQQKSSYPHED